MAIGDNTRRTVGGPKASVYTPGGTMPPTGIGQAIAAATTGGPIGPAGGDLAGTYPNPAVAQLQGYAIDSAAPSNGNVLTWQTSTGWTPVAPAGGSLFATVVDTANFAGTNVAGVLTQTSAAIVTIDGHAVASGDTVLFIAQTTGADNGLYTCTTAGTALIQAVFTRVAALNSSVEVSAGAVVITSATGAVYGDTAWILSPGTYTINVTALSFTRQAYTVPATPVYQAATAVGSAGHQAVTIGSVGNPLVVVNTATLVGIVTATLPAAATFGVGCVRVMDNSATTYSASVYWKVAPNGSDTINGTNADVMGLWTNFDQLEFYSDGISNWSTPAGSAFTIATQMGATSVAYLTMTPGGSISFADVFSSNPVLSPYSITATNLPTNYVLHFENATGYQGYFSFDWYSSSTRGTLGNYYRFAASATLLTLTTGASYFFTVAAGSTHEMSAAPGSTGSSTVQSGVVISRAQTGGYYSSSDDPICQFLNEVAGSATGAAWNAAQITRFGAMSLGGLATGVGKVQALLHVYNKSVSPLDYVAGGCKVGNTTNATTATLQFYNTPNGVVPPGIMVNGVITANAQTTTITAIASNRLTITVSPAVTWYNGGAGYTCTVQNWYAFFDNGTGTALSWIDSTGAWNSTVGMYCLTPASQVNTTQVPTTAYLTTYYAPLASPTFTGTPSLPTGTTGVTQATGNNTTKLATTAIVVATSATGLSPFLAGSVDAPPGSAATANDEFTEATFNPSSLWTNYGWTSGTAVAMDGITNMIMTVAYKANNNLNFIGQPTTNFVSSTSWAFSCKIQNYGNFQSTAAGGTTNTTSAWGIVLYESGTGKAVLFGPDLNNGDINFSVYSALGTRSSHGGGLLGGMLQMISGWPLYLRCSFDNTNYYFFVSLGGWAWALAKTITKTADFTVKADTFGIGMDNGGATNSQNTAFICDWFRDSTALLGPP